MAKYADSNGLLYLIQLIKGTFAQKTEVPTATTTTPKKDGTAAVGSETKWAKGDHVHPTDDSRAPKSHASTATTYGTGTDANYGHVKLSDSYSGTATAASGGTAATPKALSDGLATKVPTTRKVNNKALSSDVTLYAGDLPYSSTYDARTVESMFTTLAIDGVGGQGAFVTEDAAFNFKHFGTCSTAAATAQKEVTVPGFYLTTGAWVAVKFANTNSAAAANLTLKVGSSTAKPIKYRGANLGSAGVLAANRTYLFVYDGTNYEIVGDLDTNTTYSAATTSAAGLMSADDKTKLNGIASGAQVNQNAFSRVMVGSTGVEADSTTDTLNLAGDNGISLTANSGSDIVTIALDHAVVKSVNGTPPSSLTGDVQISASDLLAMSTIDGETIQDALDFLMDAKFDGAGLDYGTLINGTLTTTHFASCSTAAATATKVVQVNGFQLVAGAWVAVKFTVTNTAAVANLALQVNPASGASGTAKPIKYRGANLGSAGVLAANRTYLFVYDGTNEWWEIVGDLDTNTDTKNTAGSTDSSSKLFLIGATSQAANPQTYSQDTVYAGTDGHLYSNSKQAVNLSDTQALTNKTYNGLTLTAASTGFTIAGGTTSKTLTVNNTYTLGAACAKGVDTSISAGSTSTNLPTTKAVVDYLAGVAGALVYKGAVNAESSLLNVALKVGWFYIVSTAGTYAGQTCEAGDMIIVNTAGTYTTSAGLTAAVDVIQANIEALTNAEIDTIWSSAMAAA